jgi:hypothetical protein
MIHTRDYCKNLFLEIKRFQGVLEQRAPIETVKSSTGKKLAMKKSRSVQLGPNVSIEETFDSNYYLKSGKNQEILEIGCQEEEVIT